MLGPCSSLSYRAEIRLFGVVTALAVASCTKARPLPSPPEAQAASPASPRLDRPLEGPARLFHTGIDDSFWVSHSADHDRLVSNGVRFETSPTTGEVLAAAWELDLPRKGEPLLGALEVAARLGGGFIHWSRNHLFYSDTFTGPLRAITLGGALGVGAIRGARNGLDHVIVFGEAATAAIDRTNLTLIPPPSAGLVDLGALDARRGVRIDVLGKVASTIDGGKTWTDASEVTGISVKYLQVEPGALKILTWQGRLPFLADGRFGPLESAPYSVRRGINYVTLWPGSRAEEQNPWWTWREVTPIQAAVLSGARTKERQALALATGAIGEVDLTTAQLMRTVTEWPQPGLSCSTIAGAREPLFVCGWEMYQGYGAYVLRAAGGRLPPVMERAFSDDSFFVADDEGALGFVGSCGLTPKYLDPNDTSRAENVTEMRVANKICVRRGPDDWVEHEIELPPEVTLHAWAPKPDGTAVALTVSSNAAGLPERVNDPARVTTQGGVRIVRLPQEIGGYTLTRPQWNPYAGTGRTPSGPLVDRRVQVREDGSIEAWFSSPAFSDPSSGVHTGAVIDARGNVTLHAPPARFVMTIASGDYGLALLDDGDVAETIDHGRTYRPGGRSPLPPDSFGGSCSPLGCIVGSVTRLGWGEPKTNPHVYFDKLPDEPPTRAPIRLECSPIGTPEVLSEDSIPKGRMSWPTGYGEYITLIREVEDLPDAPPPLPPDFGPQDATPPPPKKPSKAITRTHSLLLRAPFDADALPKRIDATGSDLDNVRRASFVPLLDKNNDVGLLAITDKHELVIAGEEITTLPLFEVRRYMGDSVYPPGLLRGGSEALILGDLRRRATFEEHGPGTQKSPVFIGQERESGSRRPMGLAWRDDGTPGMIVWDGSPPDAAAAAEFDAQTRTFRALSPLATWATATAGDDPRCKNVRGWRAIVPIEPLYWFDVQSFAPFGLDLGMAGALLVRWTNERICVDGLDIRVDNHASDEYAQGSRVVVRWDASRGKRRGGALLTTGLRRRLDCRLVHRDTRSGP